MTENDRKKIEEFNRTDVPVTECLIQNIFEEQANVRPNKTAVISGEKSLTYKELDAKANQLARHLLIMNLAPCEIVGICLERSVEMVVAVLAVLKAGGCYLPLDPSFPDERINYMLENSEAKILICQKSLNSKFHLLPDISLINIDNETDLLANYSNVKPDISLTPQSFAYILYTSGSTGKPKGVRIHHQAVVNFINSMIHAPGINEDDILFAVTTLSFDISVLELFLPLSVGATVVVADTRETIDGSALIDLIETHNITFLQATPSLWNFLLASGWKGNINLKGICGGEALSTNLVRQVLPKVREFWNFYGPTETTVWSTGIKITDPDAPVLIGKPIDNTEIYILDHNNNQLPVGATGEICIGGLGVAKGYFKNPEITVQKFIPFEDGRIIYKTGDLGRFLIDGNIELFGRIDNQIKLRGFRIEPGEIESLLSQLSDVKEAVVKVHRFEENDERLVAFLNVDTEFKMTKEEIIGSLSQHLPAYMIPSFFQRSDGFPRLPNGKINKKAILFAIDESEKKHEIDFDSLTATEKKLINIWEDILKIKNIPPSENFFDIGGNSLLAIRILNKIKEEIGFTLSFKAFITTPTIIHSVNYIDSQSQIVDKTIELIHLTETTNLPLTLNQKRLWLISKLQPDIPSYIIPYTYHLLGSLDREIFQKSLEILFQRHHIVFSVIKEIDGEPYCEIVPREVKVTYIDYTGVTKEERKGNITAIVNEDSRQAFDLGRGPLYRLYLIKAAEDEYYFHMSIHHIIFDGWSQGVLVNDLSRIYNSLLNGKEIGLEELEFQQYDYAQWEKSSENIKNDDESIEFWRENLKGCSPMLNFPYDFQRKKQRSGRGSYESIQLSQDLSENLRMISKKEDTALFATLMSAFGVVMHKYSGYDDINIGLPVAYRPHTKLESIFGMFVNTVVVRLRYDKGLTFRDLIHLTRDAAMNAISHQDIAFEKVVEIANPQRSSNANPLFQVSFVWQNNLEVPLELDLIKSEKITGNERSAAFDISLYLWENGVHIEGEIEYSTDLLKQGTILRFKNNFLNFINNLVKNPDVPVESLSMISDEERTLTERINNTRTDYPKDKTITKLFEEQVILFRDKKAVVYKEEFLTYKQLNERSNQVARKLRKMGIKRDMPVGVFMDKSLEMIIGVIAILKAGGAYLPIDPDYPIQRVGFIIKESGCKVLLTQSKYINVPVDDVIMLDLNSALTYQSDVKNIENINSPTDLAYFMYTSGTTGVPKGSMIPHYSVVRLVRNINYMEMSSDDSILYTSVIVFDVTTFEIWGALLNGMTLYIAEKETILDPETLGRELSKNKITILHLTSALFTQLAEIRTDIFAGLKYLLVGGDVLSAHNINKVRKDNPRLKVINCYGPSENTTYSTTYLIDKTYDLNIPIGKPISNSTVYIFDKYLNYQPIGVIGELYVGGDGLSRGYLSREDLNKTSFIDHPYIPGEKLYKTGDFGRWLPDGNIEFHGRVDNQLKIRGFRVELEEIESIISEIEGVIETVIRPVKVEDGDYRLVAFLNVSETFKLDIEKISRRVKDKLPSFMVPSAYRFMHGFPKTINGKTDKKALIFDIDELEIKNSGGKDDFTPTESEIYKIWSEALKTYDISATDNFFDIGGNSLLAISVFSRIKTVFKIKMELRVFFDSPRINDLAEIIDLKIQNMNKKYPVNKKRRNNLKNIEGEI